MAIDGKKQVVNVYHHKATHLLLVDQTAGTFNGVVVKDDATVVDGTGTKYPFKVHDYKAHANGKRLWVRIRCEAARDVKLKDPSPTGNLTVTITTTAVPAPTPVATDVHLIQDDGGCDEPDKKKR